ncbi:hypothetical protein ACB094_03G037200 [Castanea mollissima]
MKSWKAKVDCCSWDGVTCNNKTGQVVGLNLGNSWLSGILSPNSSLFSLHHLQKLNLSMNGFIFSTIPSSFSQLVRLSHLDLSYSNFTGQIPSEISWLTKLISLDLSNFNLHLKGKDLEAISKNMTNMRELHLDHVNISSSVPQPLVTSLKILDISDNQLIGEIPQCLGNFSSSLSILNLKRNLFQGNLPETFMEGSILTSLDFSYNQIQGKIPRSLVKCRMLEVLNLGNNMMIDTFPFWLESLPELQILILRGNGFHGPIWGPHNMLGFSKLRVFDISYNNFSGKLPLKYFKTWDAMLMVQGRDNSQPEYMEDQAPYYKDSITVMNKGVEMVLVKILIIFKSIDLSNNRFHGEIPDTMGMLKDLIVLNLSSNSFTGHIPSSLGNLTELESLDLSQNKLLGEIPHQLLSLTFLAYLNLSNNQLMGLIPQGGQFWTFDNSSFEGNLGLCGPPLSKKCGHGEVPTFEPSKESSFGEWFDWKVVLIGYACGFLIGLVTRHVIISKRPNWFVRTFRVNLRRQR